MVREEITGYGGAFNERAVEFCLNNILNMTYLALDNSYYINGVAKRHGEISRHMFAQYKVDSIDSLLNIPVGSGGTAGGNTPEGAGQLLGNLRHVQTVDRQ
mgnify:CR=1 FL=1